MGGAEATVGAAGGLACSRTCVGCAAAADANGSGDDAGACMELKGFTVRGTTFRYFSSIQLL